MDAPPAAVGRALVTALVAAILTVTVAAKAAAIAAPSAAAAAAAAAVATAPPVVVFLGDSLTAGYELPVSRAYPARVAEMLAARGRPIRAVNGGVSGDTSAGGLRRLPWLLTQKPAVVVVCLGANDGLRGLPAEETERNLRAIVRQAREAGAKVLLCGILVPTNYGPDYERRFGSIFPRVAREEKVPLVPFLLAGVAGVPSLNLADGVHPNEEGQRRVAENVLPAVEKLLPAAAQKP